MLFSDIFCAVLFIPITNGFLSNTLGWVGFKSQSAIWKIIQRLWATENHARQGSGSTGEDGGVGDWGSDGWQTGGVCNLESNCWCSFCGILESMYTRRSLSFLLFSLLSQIPDKKQPGGGKVCLDLWSEDTVHHGGERRPLDSVVAGSHGSCLLPS